VEKSHGNKWRVSNQQGWRIVDTSGNVLAGKKYELTIEDVVKFLDDYEVKLKSS
jgi:hypothetical protein